MYKRRDFCFSCFDALIILTGSAFTPSFAEVMGTTALQAGLLYALGSGVVMPPTPATFFYTTVVSRDGTPLYYDRMMFTRIFRRDFGDTSSRKKMYRYIYEDIADKLDQ